ncbi:type II toxin-antitoxin system RelE/ParE family toxin [uncultured Brevibacterium sp.]|uniref:type II toxin-antitoxin system RelE/ParE family toxin n=1 Tax=uncultured Brevibacterium sp. TaxID=189678 RepID=UPI0025E20DFB|nr:type II toxin-antitoxin system RelE/ParE family toxin [uncultured Brevibacterium sp.]
MVEIRRSSTFDRWLSRLKDSRTRARLLVRLQRLSRGIPGDSKSLGGGISELRFDFGPGYRVYYSRHGGQLILLLCGGDKSSQQHDIETARRIAQEWRRDEFDQ